MQKPDVNGNGEAGPQLQQGPAARPVKGIVNKSRQRLFQAIALGLGTLATIPVGLGVLQYKAQSHRAQKLSAGKQNPILAAQSSGNTIFISHPTLEQFIANPKGFDEAARAHLQNLEEQRAGDAITTDEYETGLATFAESIQGFVDGESILSFREVVDQIKEKGKMGIKTTLNFGDSSTSGWNSNTVTENSIRVAGALYEHVRKVHPTLPDTFHAYARSLDIHMYNSRQHSLALSIAAERLKKEYGLDAHMNEHWDEIKDLIHTPFGTYATYSDEMNRIDSAHHTVNLGIPGYSSVHGKHYMKRMLERLKAEGVLPNIDAATIYFGNNDSLNNGNVQDKYYIGKDRGNYSPIPPYLKEISSGNFTRTDPDDFEENLAEMIRTLRENSIGNITLMTPVIPLDWRPGERAVNDGREVVDSLYKGSKTVSGLLDESRAEYADYGSAIGRSDGNRGENVVKALKHGQEAVKKDVLVPRRKAEYVQKMAAVAARFDVNFINLEPVLPVGDMSHQNENAKNPENITNDYCHPGEHANILLALAQSVVRNEADMRCKDAAIQALIQLGVPKELARQETEAVVKRAVVRSGEAPAAYQKLGDAERTRETWNSAP